MRGASIMANLSFSKLTVCTQGEELDGVWSLAAMPLYITLTAH